jgi:hypothetical protein
MKRQLHSDVPNEGNEFYQQACPEKVLPRAGARIFLEVQPTGIRLAWRSFTWAHSDHSLLGASLRIHDFSKMKGHANIN